MTIRDRIRRRYLMLRSRLAERTMWRRVRLARWLAPELVERYESDAARLRENLRRTEEGAAELWREARALRGTFPPHPGIARSVAPPDRKGQVWRSEAPADTEGGASPPGKGLLPPPTMTGVRSGVWWCPECKDALAWDQVTFQERHEVCGSELEWVEYSPSGVAVKP